MSLHGMDDASRIQGAVDSIIAYFWRKQSTMPTIIDSRTKRYTAYAIKSSANNATWNSLNNYGVSPEHQSICTVSNAIVTSQTQQVHNSLAIQPIVVPAI
jgi:hypothetical protein